MQAISEALEKSGFETFLPHRDGLEFSPLLPALIEQGFDQDRALVLWNKAIFALDVYQAVRGCQAMVVNLNGRVPDEGAIVEAALAWRSGKPVVGYKADLRSLYLGQDNPMVSGLFGFEIFGSINSAAAAIEGKLSGKAAVPDRAIEQGEEVASCLELGKSICKAHSGADGGMEAVAMVLKRASE